MLSADLIQILKKIGGDQRDRWRWLEQKQKESPYVQCILACWDHLPASSLAVHLQDDRLLGKREVAVLQARPEVVQPPGSATSPAPLQPCNPGHFSGPMFQPVVSDD